MKLDTVNEESAFGILAGIFTVIFFKNLAGDIGKAMPTTITPPTQALVTYTPPVIQPTPTPPPQIQTTPTTQDINPGYHEVIVYMYGIGIPTWVKNS